MLGRIIYVLIRFKRKQAHFQTQYNAIKNDK